MSDRENQQAEWDLEPVASRRKEVDSTYQQAELPPEWQEKYDAALNVITDLNHNRRQWEMSIPARPDCDPDLVISGALHNLKDQLLQALRERDELRIDLYELRQFLNGGGK